MTDYGAYVAIHKETSLGQDHFAGSIADFDYFDLLSEGISEDNQLQIVEAVSRERRRFQLGGFQAAGGMQAPVDMNTIGRLLYGALGGTYYAATGTHLFYPAEDLPTFNVERGFGGTFTNNALRYVKGVIGTLSLEMAAGSNPSVNVEWDVAAKAAGFLTTAQTLANVQSRWGLKGSSSGGDAYVPGFHHVEVAIAGVEVTNCEAVTLEIANNPDPVPRLGSRHKNRTKVQARTVGGKIDFSFDDDDEYQRFLDGTTSSTAPGTSYTPFTMELMIPFTAAYNLHMYFPSVVYKTPGGPNQSGADRKKLSCDWQTFSTAIGEVSASDINTWRTNLGDSGNYDTHFTAGNVPTYTECMMWLENDNDVIYSTQ